MLRSAPGTLTALVHGLDDEEAGRRTGEEWSIREIVAHLVDGEWAWFTRIRRMAIEERPRMEVFPNADYTKPSLDESLSAYIRSRAEDLSREFPTQDTSALLYRSAERPTAAFPSDATLRSHQAPYIRSKANGSTVEAMRSIFAADSGM